MAGRDDENVEIESAEPANESHARWRAERTTVQRVYDVAGGLTADATAAEVAEHAECSPDAARTVLDLLVDMRVVTRRDTDPVVFRRNPWYFRWRRTDVLASEWTTDELEAEIADLLAVDETLQAEFDAPSPDTVSPAVFDADDAEEASERRAELARWRRLRENLELLRTAAHRVAREAEPGVPDDGPGDAEHPTD